MFHQSIINVQRTYIHVSGDHYYISLHTLFFLCVQLNLRAWGCPRPTASICQRNRWRFLTASSWNGRSAFFVIRNFFMATGFEVPTSGQDPIVVTYSIIVAPSVQARTAERRILLLVWPPFYLTLQHPLALSRTGSGPVSCATWNGWDIVVDPKRVCIILYIYILLVES